MRGTRNQLLTVLILPLLLERVHVAAQCLDSQDGRYPHPTSCRHYLEYVHTGSENPQVYARECPRSNRFFNPFLRRCQWLPSENCNPYLHKWQWLPSENCNQRVDGAWESWTRWSGCSATCGGGYRSRTRQCNSPPPANGGSYCSGSPHDIDSCNTVCCSQVHVDGDWGAWTWWSGCSATCGGGYRSRTRQCNSPPPANRGRYCSGSPHDIDSCNTACCSQTGAPISCDETFTNLTGVINSPNYPSNYYNGASCHYSVTVPEGFHIFFSLVSFNLESHSSCGFDSLTILTPFFKRFCGFLSGESILIPSNNVTAVFTTDGSVTRSGFHIEYQAMEPETIPPPVFCNESFTNLTGVISSPNYPDNYHHDASCHYSIAVPEGFHISLSFLSFEVESQSSCSYDSLTILTPSFMRYCGRLSGRSILIPSNNVTAVFTTDGSVASSGFHIEYQALEPPTIPPPFSCDDTFTNLTGAIYSPNYPANYPTSASCHYSITVPEGFHIFISLVSFDVRFETTCRLNSFTILTPFFKQFCAILSGEDILIPSNNMTAVFTSHSVFSSSGFHIEYQAVEPEATPPPVFCNEYFTNLTGVISSPNYPDNYHHDASCYYSITIPEGFHISLSLVSFDVEYQSFCSYDSLTILTPSYRRYCGRLSGESILIPSNNVTAVFTTDGSVASSGFHIEYQALEPPTIPPPFSCDETFTNLTGVIYSPNYPANYLNDISCHYSITVPVGFHIFFSLVSFNVELASNCVYDSLTILTPFYMRYCGMLTGDGILIPNNTLTAAFTTDGSVTLSGFHIEYQALEPGTTPPIDFGCGADYSDTTSGEITSPGFPNPYSSGVRCVWLITVPENMGIRFTIHSFDLVQGCQDVISIRHGGYYYSHSTRQLCDSNIEPIFYSDNTNAVALVFSSIFGGSEGNATGFNITYEAFDPNAPMPANPEVPCGVVPRFIGPNQRIVGGQDAEPNAYPWQIYMLKHSRLLCAGNVVNESWILTAAHCVEDRDISVYEVVAGAHNRGLFEIGIQRRSVDLIISHPDYSTFTLDNDIALMHMAQPLRWTDYVRPICIAAEMANVGTECIISGWGRTEGPLGTPDILQYVQVPILDTKECHQSYQDGGFFPNSNNITNNMFCAGFYEGGKDTCSGDSGGPLACYLDDRYELMGITSWGRGCAEEFFPGVYTRVVNYLDFIASSTNGEVLPLP